MLSRSARRRWLSAAATSGFISLLAACGSTSTPAASSAVSSAPPAASSGTATGTGSSAQTAAAKAYIQKFLTAPTTINQTVPLTGKPAPGKTYVVIGCELPQCKTISDGALEAAKTIGWKTQYLQYATTDGSTLTSAMKQALQYHPFAVSPVGFSQQVWTQLQPEYKQAGAFIVPIAVGDVQTSDVVTLGSSSQVDYTAAGDLLANWFTADSNASGKALVMDVPAFAVLKAYGDAFKAEVNKICSGCRLSSLDIAPAQLATNGVVPAIVSALQRDPSIKYVVATDGAFVAGLPSALKAAGINGIKIAGGAADITNTEALAAGTEAAWTLEPTDQFGWVAVDIAARKVLGMPILQAAELRPQMLATPQNVGTPSNFLEAPKDYRAQYKKLWGVS